MNTTKAERIAVARQGLSEAKTLARLHLDIADRQGLDDIPGLDRAEQLIRRWSEALRAAEASEG